MSFNSNIGFLGADDQDLRKGKKRGRPSSANTTSQKWSKDGENFDFFFSI